MPQKRGKDTHTEHIGGLLLCNHATVTMIFRLASGEPSGRQRQIAVIILGTWFDRAEQWLTCQRIYLVYNDAYAAKNGSAICGLYMGVRGEHCHRPEDRTDTHCDDMGDYF